jgi:alkanesulfonate monooxygenase SsuD/methylene tetrahydromethanopterin reductase-like flavin-dependent oxidoreductase (luciferase family)
MSASAAPLKIGVHLPFSERQMQGATPRWQDIATLARRAEEVGFDSIWIADHLLFRFAGIESRGGWECLSLLAALAASTNRVELGTLVVCTGFRNPALLAKIADTIEEISGGRLILGIGAGYHEPEYRAFGYPYDHRVSRFEEAVRIISGLLKTGQVDFAGQFYQARECELRPRGPRAGGPPLMIGTKGARMLRLTARYADLWNGWVAFDTSRPSAVPPLREAVDAACREVGRDPATLGRTLTVLVDFVGTPDLPVRLIRPDSAPEPIVGSPAEIARALRAFTAEGITHIQVALQPNNLAGIERFAPVIEELRRES